MALNPVTQDKVVIENKEQIYRILMDCYNEAIEKGYDVGESLYQQHFFFANSSQLYCEKSQNLIKKYIFCSSFNCPPYPSLQETPAQFVDDFLTIKKTISKAQQEDN